MTTVFYNQHQLTAGHIRREEAKNRAIARNRAKSPAVQAQTKGEIFIKDPSASATDPQKNKIWALLKELYRVDRSTWQTASTWINANIDTFNMGVASKTIDRLKLRITEAGGQTVALNPDEGKLGETYPGRLPDADRCGIAGARYRPGVHQQVR